jgi:hypothetical protein
MQLDAKMEPASKRSRTLPGAQLACFMDLPVDVIRIVQEKTFDATTRLRLQSLIPKAMWARRETDSQLSLIEYCSKRGRLADNRTTMEFLFARTEASAREILESMADFPVFVRGKNLMADIAEKLRDASELPSAQDIAGDFIMIYGAIQRLAHRSVEFFDKFVATDMFGHMKIAFPRGGIRLYEWICRAENERLFRRVRDLARDDPWFRAIEKNCETRVFEIKMSGDCDSDVVALFDTAVSNMNMPVVRDLFDRASKIRKDRLPDS